MNTLLLSLLMLADIPMVKVTPLAQDHAVIQWLMNDGTYLYEEMTEKQWSDLQAVNGQQPVAPDKGVKWTAYRQPIIHTTKNQANRMGWLADGEYLEDAQGNLNIRLPFQEEVYVIARAVDYTKAGQNVSLKTATAVMADTGAKTVNITNNVITIN